jgi:dihydrofolate reductase (trimethoprim resistance protein)
VAVGCGLLDLGRVLRVLRGQRVETNQRLNVEQSSSVSVGASNDHQIQPPFSTTFELGDRVRKRSGAAWQGRIVGWYSTQLTPEGYAVESEAHPGSVQIYPVAALERLA